MLLRSNGISSVEIWAKTTTIEGLGDKRLLQYANQATCRGLYLIRQETSQFFHFQIKFFAVDLLRWKWNFRFQSCVTITKPCHMLTLFQTHTNTILTKL